jgi:3-hydroxyisobutyrate dehydrogenase
MKTMKEKSVAFLGLGIMGSGMAARLLAHGFNVTVYNRDPQKAAPLAKAGATAANTPREAAQNGEIIISMVADDAAARAVWLGENGALAGASPGAVLVESSTITVDWVSELAAVAAQKGCELLDAPVTGSKNQAASGELNFLVGGSTPALEKARPALAAMSRSVVHLGPSGSGALLKLINNFLCGVQVASLAEAMALIEKGGLDRARALEIVTSGAPGSPLIKTVSARMTGQDYVPNFLLRLMAKDLAYAVAEGDKLSIDLATAGAALGLFKQAASSGHGEQDIAAVVEQFRTGPIQK